MKRAMLFVAIVFVVYGLTASSVNARYIQTHTDNWPHLISSVQVLDSSEEPMQGLSDNNFRAMVNGRGVDSLRITSYEESGQGLHIILCIDASGSMRGSPIESIKAAVVPFIDRIRTVDKVAIATYSDDFRLLTDFTGEKELLKQTVLNIRPAGRYTSLYYGAYKAVERLKTNEEMTGKIMVLMGDGKDENPGGSYSENDVIDLAKRSGIPIFTIGYTAAEQVYLQSLERMAETTGGTYYYSPRTSDLTSYFEKLYRQIMNINLLSYIVVGLAGDGAEHNLGIELITDLGSRDLSAKITAPAGKPSYTSSVKKSKSRINPVVIAVIFALALAIAATTILLSRRAKQKKENLAAEFRRIEEQKNREIEQERLRIAALEEEKGKLVEHSSKAASQDLPDKKVLVKPPDRDRTMILGAKGAGLDPKVGASSLRMEILLGLDAGKVYTIDQTGAKIGRAQDNSIILTDKTVSSHHVIIRYADGSFLVEDLDSTNGVYINGNKTQIYRLEVDCSFKFGSVEGNFTLI